MQIQSCCHTEKYDKNSLRPDLILGLDGVIKLAASSIQNKCALFKETSNFPRPPSLKSHSPRIVVDVINNNPRDVKSKGFKPIVQSDKDMLNCAGGGIEAVTANDSAVARVARVIESV